MNNLGWLLKLILAPGQIGDAPPFFSLGDEKLLEGLYANNVLADTAYDSDSIRQRVKKMWAKTFIKPKVNEKARRRCFKERYRHRNVIERFFGALKLFRRIPTRYEKKAANFAGFLWLVVRLAKPLRLTIGHSAMLVRN